MKKLFWFFCLFLLTGCCGVVLNPSPAVAQSSVKLKASLTGPAIHRVRPMGKATFESHGSRTKFKVEVEYVNLENGTVLSVNVNNAAVGSVSLYAGHGELELQGGYYGVGGAPSVKKGDMVTVTTADGTIILHGKF